MTIAKLQKDSGLSLPSYLFSSSDRNKLMKATDTSMWGNTYKAVNDISKKAVPISSVYSRRKVSTFSKGTDGSFTKMLNKQLLGGDSYPVLEFALGVGVGAVSGPAGMLFSVACLGLSLSKTTYYALARDGDELWQVEQIGLDGKDTVHVSSYFLYDPLRAKGFSGANGWLIHEERVVLTV